MIYDLDKGSHYISSLYYYFIQVVKYKNKIFTNDASVDFLNTKASEIAYTFNMDIPCIECDRDHTLINIP
jgi:REP element-mobilizing transposase RayT